MCGERGRMSGSRTYRGMSAQERVAERRERVLAAAFDRFGRQGYPATTIDLLCADAKISTRAFYQCFDGREAVLSALFHDIVNEALAQVRAAIHAAGDSLPEVVRAGLSAYVGYMITDDRRARIAHVEVRRAGDPLIPDRRRVVYEFAGLVTELIEQRGALDDVPGVDGRHLAVGLLGAVQELIIAAVHDDPGPTQEELLSTAEYIFLATLRDRDTRVA